MTFLRNARANTATGAVLLLTTALAFAAAAGCAARVATRVTGTGGSGSAGEDSADGGGGAQPTPDEVVIRFLNLTDVGVDTQFHITNEPLEDPQAQLFDVRFRLQTGIGAFSSGRLLPDESADIIFPCTETTVMGTAGGEFLDPELATPITTGQARILQVGDNFDCGNTILFTFRGQNGDYSTEPPIVDFRD